MEYTFKNNGYSWDYRTKAKNPLNKVTVCTPQHFHASLLEQIFKVKKFDFIFTVVRCPYARIQSEYAMRTKSSEKITGKFLNRWLEKKFREYEVNSFVNDNHIRPQHEFLLKGAAVYRLESGLNNIFKDISKNINDTLVFNSGERGMSSVKRHGYSSSDVELDQTAIDMINEFYALDFSLLGYEKR